MNAEGHRLWLDEMVILVMRMMTMMTHQENVLVLSMMELKERRNYSIEETETLKEKNSICFGKIAKFMFERIYFDNEVLLMSLDAVEVLCVEYHPNVVIVV